ncbi:MAG TPA: GMC oxidoreductase [Sandaracinaceae bacterium LLY-WYZ-13_1]|nr:GMC oxidoreductase [Sandaracinaceae bacterium LLY-WYZ-13_1]
MTRSIPWLHRFGRRSFLRRAAVGTAGLAVLGCGSDEGPVVELTHPLIVGSGFGGSVAALRFAEAGLGATVLERGRRWELGEFCSMREADERAAWFSRQTHVGISVPVRRYAGLIEKFAGDHIDAMLPAAVGGGSLVYAGMMVRPPRDLFESVFGGEVSYDAMQETWYPRVAEELPMGTIPSDVLESDAYGATRIFLAQAEAAGLTPELNLNTIDWERVRLELSGELPAEASVGDYIYGLNSGAKGQVDRTYLARAEASGLVDVRPLHQVTGVAADPGGGYRVRVERIDEWGEVLERSTFRAPALVLAAGSVHTTRLLVEARARGDLPDLDASVGQGWGHNGQHIHMRNDLGLEVGAYQGGPPAAVIRDLDNPVAPVTVEHGAAAFGYDCGCLICPSSSLNDGLGRLVWDAASESTALEWDPANGRTGVDAGEAVSRRLNEANGGVIAPLIGRTRTSTFHPLGGVVMGRAADTFGRVHGYDGLYVVDGALIGGSTPTANPAWTIAALAERCLDTIVGDF